MRHYISVLPFILFFISTVSLANDFQLSASVSQNPARIGRPFTYTVSVSGSDIPTSPELSFPNFPSTFQVRGTQKSQTFSYDSRIGKPLRTLKYVITLIPNELNTFNIPPSVLNVNGAQYRSSAIEVLVTQNASSTSPGESIQPDTQSSTYPQDIFVVATIDKPTVFVGEQFSYTLSLYRRIRLYSDIQHSLPPFTGFISEALSINSDTTVNTIEGRKYYGQTLSHNALIPLKPGKSTISESQVGVVLSVFDGQKVLQSKSIPITVLPLPEMNKPQRFSGAVGEYTLSGRLDKVTVTQGEPITYTIDLSGDGYLKSINDLHFDNTGDFKIYPPNISDDITYQSKMTGTRRFEYVLIPQTSGTLTLPRFSLPVFSPQSKTYVIAQTAPETISVIANESIPQNDTPVTASRVDTDINYLKPISELDTVDRYPWQHIFGKFIILLNIGLLLWAIIIFATPYIYRPDPKKINAKKAFSTAITHLNRLQSNRLSPDKTISQLYNLLLGYLSDKSGVSFTGLTLSQMKDTLRSNQFSDAYINSIVKLINKVSELAYSANSLDENRIHALIDESRQVLTEIETR